MFEVASVLLRGGRALRDPARGSRGFVYVDLPRTGLGHKILVWARALAFARMNQMPLFTSGWSQLKLGPILRRERSARLYYGYFDDPCAIGPVGPLLLLRAARTLRDPDVGPLPAASPREPLTAYVFHEAAHWSDSFKGIREERDAVRSAFRAMVRPEHLRDLAAQRPPVIGVHVRHGDFRPLRPGEDFAKVGHVRAPISYFRARVLALREVCGEVPVTVFSDGKDADLAELLELPRVSRAVAASDLVDLLRLAGSQVILTSPGSSFGLFAGFLADAPVLHDPQHFHAPSRPPDVNARWFEGPTGDAPKDWPPLLLENLQRVGARSTSTA